MKTHKQPRTYGRFEFRLSDAQREEITRLANELELSPTQVIRLAIRDFVKRHDAEATA